MGRYVLFGLLGAVAAVVAVGAGFVILDDRSAPPIVISDPRPDATIVVGVGGAVASPGVYGLAGDARAQDAIAAAGGANADADLASINLARRLADEDQLVVPRVASTRPRPAAEEGSPAGQSAEVEVPTVPVSPSGDGLIDLNTASLSDLDGLPGIGPALA